MFRISSLSVLPTLDVMLQRSGYANAIKRFLTFGSTFAESVAALAVNVDRVNRVDLDTILVPISSDCNYWVERVERVDRHLSSSTTVQNSQSIGAILNGIR